MEDEFETPKPSKIKALLPYVGVLVVGLGAGFGGSLAMPAEDAGDDPTEEGAPAAGEHGGGAGGEAEHAAAGDHGAPAEGGHGEAAEPEGHGAAKPATVKVGQAQAPWISNLGTFTVNLRGGGGGRVLRMEVQLDAPESDAATLEQLTPKLRDAVFTAVSDYTWSELEGADGKIRLKDELLTRINGITDPVVVRSIYLTQFVVS